MIQPADDSDASAASIALMGSSIEAAGITRGTALYEYDEFNRLTSYSDLKGNSAEYTYYADGLRKSKTVGEDTTEYYYNGQNVINETKNASEYATNIIGVNGYICRTQDGITGYFLRDGHGDIQTAYAEDRTTKLADYTYDAWGNQNNTEVLSWGESNPIRYAGQYYDTESDMIYLRARYYDSSMGRFINEDPAKDGLNWYSYCGNNPIMFIDPSGLRDVMVKYAIERNGGTVQYDADNNQAVVTLYEKTVRYDLTNDNVVNGRLMLDTSVLVNDFNLSEDTYLIPQPGDHFDCTADAATAWAIQYYDESVADGKEYGSVIYGAYDGNKYYYSFGQAEIGFSDSVSIRYDLKPPKSDAVSNIHSHIPDEHFLSESLSGDDVRMANEVSYHYAYLATPSRTIYRYYPDRTQNSIGQF